MKVLRNKRLETLTHSSNKKESSLICPVVSMCDVFDTVPPPSNLPFKFDLNSAPGHLVQAAPDRFNRRQNVKIKVKSAHEL